MANYVATSADFTRIHSHLEPYLRLMEPIVRDFDWLWTDIEIAGDIPDFTADRLGRIWLTGSQLIEHVYGGPQIAWSVLTAVFPHDRENAMTTDLIPFADGNTECWSATRGPQHPFGYLELVCFDSTATLLIGGDDFATNMFQTAFPEARQLRAGDA